MLFRFSFGFGFGVCGLLVGLADATFVFGLSCCFCLLAVCFVCFFSDCFMVWCLVTCWYVVTSWLVGGFSGGSLVLDLLRDSVTVFVVYGAVMVIYCSGILLLLSWLVGGLL